MSAELLLPAAAALHAVFVHSPLFACSPVGKRLFWCPSALSADQPVNIRCGVVRHTHKHTHTYTHTGTQKESVNMRRGHRRSSSAAAPHHCIATCDWHRAYSSLRPTGRAACAYVIRQQGGPRQMCTKRPIFDWGLHGPTFPRVVSPLRVSFLPYFALFRTGCHPELPAI